MNAPATWRQRRNALRNEPAAKWAMQLAVLSSLGAIGSWSLLLVSGDPRRSGTFWLMALAVGIWGAPVQAYVRWTMLSLWAFLLLWPAVALAALIFNAGLDAGAARSTLLMGGVLGYTVIASLAGLWALRRSSLPFGKGQAALYPDGYKPPGALPGIDAQLRSIQFWFMFPFIATIMMMSAVFAATIVMADADGAGIAVLMGPMFLVCIAQPVLLGWGQYQSRRSLGRRPSAFLALALLQSGLAVGGGLFVFVLGLVQGSAGGAGAGVALEAVALAVVACDAAAWRRIRARAASYGGR